MTTPYQHPHSADGEPPWSSPTPPPAEPTVAWPPLVEPRLVEPRLVEPRPVEPMLAPPTPPGPWPTEPVPVVSLPAEPAPVVPLPAESVPTQVGAFGGGLGALGEGVAGGELPLGYYAVAVPDEPRVRGTIIASIAVTLVVSGLGFAVGYAWLTWAPRVAVVRSGADFFYADSEPEQAIGGDGWFAFLGIGVGIVVTVLAWVLLRRYRGTAMMIALVLGSLVGAWLAWWFGVRLGVSQFEAVRDTVAEGTRLSAPLVLRLTDLDRHALWPPKATGVVCAQALAAAITYTVLAGFSAFPGLRGPDRVELHYQGPVGPPGEGPTGLTAGLSSDPAAPAGPPA